MSMPGFEAQVLQMIGDIKEQIGELRGISEQTLRQATKTNGGLAAVTQRVNVIEAHCAERAGMLEDSIPARIEALEREKAGRDELKIREGRDIERGRNKWRNAIAIGAVTVSLIALVLNYVFPYWK